MSRLWAFDPGGTTGFALFESLVDSGQYQLSVVGTAVSLVKFLEMIKTVDTVVIEQVISLHPSFDQIGIEKMGALALICESKGIIPVYQKPGVCKAVQRWKLIDFKIWKTQHERDAVAHGVNHIGLGNVLLGWTDA